MALRTTPKSDVRTPGLWTAPLRSGSAHIKDQLFRSSTSVAANYAEASVPESRKDFVHKMNIALKELVETRMWLRIIVLQQFIAEKTLSSLLQETDALAKIFHASVMTARRRLATDGS